MGHAQVAAESDTHDRKLLLKMNAQSQVVAESNTHDHKWDKRESQVKVKETITSGTRVSRE